MDTYEIYALRYAGPLKAPAMMHKWMCDFDQTAERGYVLETGRIVMEDQASSLLSNPKIRQAYLGEG